MFVYRITLCFLICAIVTVYCILYAIGCKHVISAIQHIVKEFNISSEFQNN